MEKSMELFKNGSVWLKADFHLHTKADKEFRYNGAEDKFVTTYISKLKAENISVSVITNHNKFDKEEFKNLKKEAINNNICLFAGIELSLKEGIHIIIVFKDDWYNGENKIQQFIDNAFYGINNFGTAPHPNSCYDSKNAIDALNRIGFDYFIILAHVDDTNGLFKVLSGRTLDAFVQQEAFDKILAVQKSGNKDNYKKLCSLAGRQIACVEGTDNAKGGIDAIGKGRITYIKLGAFDFEALKYTLTDKDNRLKPEEEPEIKNSYIKSISFEGGLLDTKEIHFSPELNNFIGIRGSGKSSIIEILRYTLGISLGSQASDRDYKNSLIEHVLKSGAKITVNVVNEHKKEYRIEKIYGQKEDIYENNVRVDATIDAIFNKPVYFGQKDLSNKNIDFEADLVKKLIGNRIDDIHSRIVSKSNEIESVINSFKKLENLEELKKETNESIKNAEEKLKIFKEKGVQDKLRQQSNFDSDISVIKNISSGLEEFKRDLNLLVENHSVFFKNTVFKSDENKEIFQKVEKIFENIKSEFNKIHDVNINTDKFVREFKELEKNLKDKKESLKEEFAKIKREIDIPNINPDDFLKLNRQIETSKLKLIEIERAEKKRTEHLTSLNNKISELNNLWYEEYKIVEKEVKRINDYKNALSISAEYKGRSDKFSEKMKQLFKGSGIRDAAYQNIQTDYKDFIEIYRDKGKLNNILNENQLAEFNKRFAENLYELLTYQVETKFTINYNGKPLKEHSLGQRATALILFLLAQKETDVLIIDQPEDDLDNQTIYEDVIKEIKSLKGKMQFIFATHNANIPVLGDSEKIISCKYSELKIDVQGGTVDNHETQKQIVTIMEGGEEAFNRRKNIYELWSLKK